MTTENILALDAGQTGIRALWISGEKTVESDYPGLRTDLELFPQLARVVQDVADKSDSSFTLAIGMTGLTKSQSRPDEFLHQLSEKVSQLFLAHDSVTGFLGSMGLGQGTVTAVGTGVVTLSLGEKDLARVDGWGNLIGDAGSAYWIGRAALEAGMRGYDGRLPRTSLTDLLSKHFANPEEAYIELQTNENRVAVIASFAPEVIEMAETDTAAHDIVQKAGEELALSALTAARRTGLVEISEPHFSWAGNAMKANLLRKSFTDSLKKNLPSAVIHEPLGFPVNGVALLPTLASESPLQQMVHFAARVSSRN